MILDDLKHVARYAALHPGFAAAFEQLRRRDLATLAVGRHEIDGDRLVLIIGKDEGRGRSAAQLEAHRRYIDVQYAIDGDEEIGWRLLSDCHSIAEPYSEERDVVLFSDTAQSWLAVPPGKFTIFFPDDAHAPLAGSGLLHKAVVKVAVEW